MPASSIQPWISSGVFLLIVRNEWGLAFATSALLHSPKSPFDPPQRFSNARMITLGSTLTHAREAGVVYTKPWTVERVLAGTLPEKRLADLVALEPPGG